MSKRDAYVQKLQAQLDEWNAEVDKLKAKADKAQADAQLAYHKQIDSLREQQQAAHAKLNELRQSSEDAWEDLKEGVEGAWSQLGDAVKWLKENLDVDVLFWRGKPINVEIPSFIEAVITQCDPGVKGDTASGATKPATLETGAVVQVPLFIKEGETIRVDTRSGDYVERVG